MTSNNKDRSAMKSSPAAAAPPPRPVIDVRVLMGEAREAILVHQGESYRLRVTANDKLILTK